MTLMMSVSGVRGIVGETMTPTLAAELGAAFGSQLGDGAVIVARDSRPSGEMLASAIKSGLLATGRRVIELGIVTTPGAALMIRERRAAGGIVVTASHNPIEWNGIKFLTAEGHAPPSDQAAQLFERYREKRFDLVPSVNVGELERDLTTHDRHVTRVVQTLNVEAIRSRQLRVVLDSVNGAGGFGGRMLLEHLGCKLIHVNAEANGRFAHPPEPTAANLTSLCDAVREHQADVGFAQDPDADRLAIVDNKGRYIGEEYTLALCARRILGKSPGPIAANLSTSRMVDAIAESVDGASVVRTPVGEAHVAAAIRECNCVFGGEGNGGVIDPRVVSVRDSFVGMGLVLDLLAEDWRPLDVIVDEMPTFVMVKEKYEMAPDAVAAWLERIVATVTDGQVNNSDGIRIDWPTGWIHVRPSNTEPIARIIAEAEDEATVHHLVERVNLLR